MNDFLKTYKKEFAALERSDKQLRKFGLLVGGILLLLTVIFGLMHGGNIKPTMPIIGTILVLAAVLLPRSLYYPYLLWMGFSIVLGFFIGNIIWSLLFYILITPIGLIMRVIRKKDSKDIKTYWITRENGWTKESMEQLF